MPWTEQNTTPGVFDPKIFDPAIFDTDGGVIITNEPMQANSRTTEVRDHQRPPPSDHYR